MSENKAYALDDDELEGVAGGQLVTETVTITYYIVEKGDTLSGIAEKLGIKLKDILKANPQIINPDKIEVGQKITIKSVKEKPKE